MISTTTTASPFGELVLGASERGLRFVLWPGERRRLDLGSDAAAGSNASGDTDEAIAARERVLADAVEQLEEYFAGTQTTFDLPLDPVGTAFQRSIVVPCHRVVGANGSLTGFAGGIESKAWLLDHERRVIAST